MRRRIIRSTLVAVFYSTPIVTSLHIAPLPSREIWESTTFSPGGSPYSVYPIDASAFDEVHLGFGGLEIVEIQLLSSLPVWTFYASQQGLHNDTFFVGQDEEGLVVCNLWRHVTAEERMILTGRIVDRSTDYWYEIKPTAEGDVSVTVREIDDDAPSIEDKGLEVSFWDLVQSYGYGAVAREYTKTVSQNLWTSTVGTRASDDEEVVLDVMVIWSQNSECQRSDLPLNCELTETTRSNMEAAVRSMIIDTNLVHDNSETGVVYNLVHMQRDSTGYVEAGSINTLANLVIPAVDGQLNYIQGLRYDSMGLGSCQSNNDISFIARMSPLIICP